MSWAAYRNRFRVNMLWAGVIGFLITMAGGFLSRFSRLGWLFMPFGIEALGPLGDVIFNSCWAFLLLSVFYLSKSK